MFSGQPSIHRLAIALSVLLLSLSVTLRDAGAMTPEPGPVHCSTEAVIAPSLDCLESDAPLESSPNEAYCALSITLTNACEVALTFYDGDCVARADGELDEGCRLAVIPAGAELEVPLEAGRFEDGTPFIGDDTAFALLMASDGEDAHEISLTLSKFHQGSNSSDDDVEESGSCSSGGAPSSPNRLLIIVLMGWIGLRAMAAAPRAGARA